MIGGSLLRKRLSKASDIDELKELLIQKVPT